MAVVTIERQARPGEAERPTVQLRDRPAVFEGEWIVTTPRNPDYAGLTERVLFSGGRAVVYERWLARKFAGEYGYDVSGPSLDGAAPAPAAAPAVRGDIGAFESDASSEADPLEALASPPTTLTPSGDAS